MNRGPRQTTLAPPPVDMMPKPQPSLVAEGWVGAEEIADMLNLSSKHVRMLAEKGRIPSVDFGMGKNKHFRFQKSEVQRALRQQQQG